MHITIKQAESAEEFKQYYHLRWKLLRAPWQQPEGSEIDAIEEQCVHLIAITGQSEVIGVARLQYNSAIEAQIRYMAVAPDHERLGIGRRLVETFEALAAQAGCQLMVLDAREPALDFYHRLGYQVTEKSYLLFDSIQHYRMHKKI